LKVLFDTNILLDVLLNRKPFSETAAQLIGRVESAEIEGFVCATTMTTLHYLATKAMGRVKAIEQVALFLKLFDVAPVNRAVLESALTSRPSDFEDGVLMTAAHHAGVEAIITRNLKDFKNAPLPIYHPKEFLKMLQSAS